MRQHLIINYMLNQEAAQLINRTNSSYYCIIITNHILFLYIVFCSTQHTYMLSAV